MEINIFTCTGMDAGGKTSLIGSLSEAIGKTGIMDVKTQVRSERLKKIT